MDLGGVILGQKKSDGLYEDEPAESAPPPGGGEDRHAFQRPAAYLLVDDFGLLIGVEFHLCISPVPIYPCLVDFPDHGIPVVASGCHGRRGPRGGTAQSNPSERLREPTSNQQKYHRRLETMDKKQKRADFLAISHGPVKRPSALVFPAITSSSESIRYPTDTPFSVPLRTFW